MKTLKRQAHFWTKEWQEAEKEASEDIKAGRVKTFDTVEELLADLEEKQLLRLHPKRLGPDWPRVLEEVVRRIEGVGL